MKEPGFKNKKTETFIEQCKVELWPWQPHDYDTSLEASTPLAQGEVNWASLMAERAEPLKFMLCTQPSSWFYLSLSDQQNQVRFISSPAETQGLIG